MKASMAIVRTWVLCMVGVAWASDTATAPQSATAPVGLSAALQSAAQNQRHLYCVVYEQQDETTVKLQELVKTTVQDLSTQAQWVGVDRKAADNKAFVQKYGLDRAPMPLVFVIAPNGAVTGGFPAQQATRPLLEGAIAGPALQKCLLALQERKLVLLCLQNGSTQQNEAAMKAVHEFAADARFAQATQIVLVDPASQAERKFLAQLNIGSDTKVATTVLLAPPNAALGVFTGATTKDVLVNTLVKALSSSGCGPSGCGPSGCGPQ